jgi:hypothetical protein
MDIRIYRRTAALFWLLLVIFFGSGCGAENPGDDGPAVPSWNDNNNPGGAGGAVAPVGGSFAGAGGSEAGSGPAPGQWVHTDAGPDECASFTAEAVRIEEVIETVVEVEVTEENPVSIYIMLDQSGSMMIPDISILPRWNVAYDAINAFVNDPASADIAVALQYFPLPDAGCDGSTYDTPDVPMGLLPGHAATIINSLNTHAPFNNDTPIEPALLGATRFCQRYKTDPVANPDGRNCAVVFITDGMPSLCNQDFGYISDIAGNAFNGDPSVPTFAIGMFGADFLLMNQIAEKGGTDCTPNPDGTRNPSDGFACDVSAGMTLIQALEVIRQAITRIETHIEYETIVEREALECEWEIPAPPEGEIFDRNKVNVDFWPEGANGAKQSLSMAESEAACGTATTAWYYDNPDDPTRIIACPETCAQIKAAELGRIDIVLGCQTILLE